MRHPTLLDVSAPFPIWSVNLSEPPADRTLAWLSDAELARAARFAFEPDRTAYLAAHVALRRLLADATGMAPGSQRFGIGALGKPYLETVEGLDFSMSYAGRTGLVGIARGDIIGVDAEALRVMEDREALAEGLFTAAERAEPVSGCPDTHFLRGWTAKEACMKAIGTGLSTPPITFETGFLPGRRNTTIAAPDADFTLEVETFIFGATIIDATITEETIVSAWARAVPGGTP